MKVGDIVKLLDHWEVHRNNCDVDPNALGIITKWTCHGDSGPLASAWVQWLDESTPDCMFAEDLEVVSASR